MSRTNTTKSTPGWTRVGAAPGMGLLTEQWIFRPDRAPLCSLRRDPEGCGWQANLLRSTGISAATMWLGGALTLPQAQAASETELRAMGWEWGDNAQSRAQKEST